MGRVDRAGREVRLRTSKNGKGRVLPLEGELWEIIERRWAARTFEVEGEPTRLAEFVFHRAGDRVVDHRDAWEGARTKANLPAMKFHDLRRTAARNMVRAGVAETVAMTITGHKTRSMFARYDSRATLTD